MLYMIDYHIIALYDIIFFWIRHLIKKKVLLLQKDYFIMEKAYQSLNLLEF
jgi:hypothetical protein